MSKHKAEGVAANEREVRFGGLMRCCIATISETTTLTNVGDTLSCAYESEENNNMIVAEDGVWEWIGPKQRTQL